MWQTEAAVTVLGCSQLYCVTLCGISSVSSLLLCLLVTEVAQRTCRAEPYTVLDCNTQNLPGANCRSLRYTVLAFFKAKILGVEQRQERG